MAARSFKAQIDAAVEELRKIVDASDVDVLIGGLYKRDELDKPFERLLVINPDGQIVQTYYKMWQDARFNDCPGIFHIDGVPCAAALCADRWIRKVEVAHTRPGRLRNHSGSGKRDFANAPHRDAGPHPLCNGPSARF